MDGGAHSRLRPRIGQELSDNSGRSGVSGAHRERTQQPLGASVLKRTLAFRAARPGYERGRSNGAEATDEVPPARGEVAQGQGVVSAGDADMSDRFVETVIWMCLSALGGMALCLFS